MRGKICAGIAAIALILAMCLTGCGKTAENAAENAAGSKSDTQTAVSVEKYLIFRFGEGETSMDGELLKASGMDKSYLELNSDHTGKFVLADAETSIEWNDAGEIFVSGAKLYSFEVKGDVVSLDMLGTPIAFVKEGAQVPDWLAATGGRPAEEARELIPVQPARGFDLYYASEMSMEGNDTVYDCLSMGMTPDDTNLQINKDGSGTLTMGGTPTNMEFSNGTVSAWGTKLYTYEIVSADELKLDMQGIVYTFLREGSELAIAKGLTEGAHAVVDASSYQPKSYEIKYEFDGNTCYYRLRDYGFDGDLAYITWLYADCDDLYIPAEINGAKVVRFGYMEGHAKRLYIPGTVQYIGYHLCSEEWGISGIQEVYFGYGDYPVTEYIDILHFIDNGEDVEKIAFSNYMDKDHERWMCGFNMLDPGDYPKLKEVVNLPQTWDLSYKGHKALLEFLANKNPQDYIHPQSDIVTDLALELTEGCTTDEEKLYKMSEWICDNISYDTFELRASYGKDHVDDYGNRFEREQEPEDLIRNRVGVCDGYARLTVAMCNAVGIPAARISGVTPGIRHAYNVIYINGKWGIYDNCENDTDYNLDLSLRSPETYFNGAVTYEQYMANEEMQQAYTWEEVQDMNEVLAQGKHFAEHHPYWDADPAQMPSAIPEYVDGVRIPYEHPELNELMDAKGRYAAGVY